MTRYRTLATVRGTCIRVRLYRTALRTAPESPVAQYLYALCSSTESTHALLAIVYTCAVPVVRAPSPFNISVHAFPYSTTHRTCGSWLTVSRWTSGGSGWLEVAAASSCVGGPRRGTPRLYK